tara:strand:+ start:452 stop:964 length:513 start_codon:yes stop_codon:yes gene_type:complete
MTTTPKKKTTTKRKAPVKRVKLPPNPFIHEIFDLVSEQRTKAKRVEILKEYRDDSVTAVLIWNFDERVVSAVPEGEVPYKPNEVPVGTDHTSLRREWKNLFHFIKGGNPSLSSLRRETMFVQMLEGLHPTEAEIICLVKDKDLKKLYPKITFDIVKEAYPDIVWGEHRGS